MKIDFNVYNYDYDKRAGNLKAEAKGVVKSQKYFPYFYEDGKKIIYKPLSKTKPLSTPYFAFSEVVWSNLINRFFDKDTPIYRLAKCTGYEKEVPKYHSYGTAVESVVKENENLVNIYEYFEKNPDPSVNISNYINYCLTYYDYTFFFESLLFKNNPKIAKEVSKQILYSILRADQNYHYENVSFVYEGNCLKKVSAPIDHEFSTMFMFLYDETSHIKLFGKYMNEFIEETDINISPQNKMLYNLFGSNLNLKFKSEIIKNIETIVKLYPGVVEEFIISLNNMVNHLNEEPITLEDHGYIEPFNSDEYEVGILRYKENKIEEADQKIRKINKKEVMPTEVNKYINTEIVNSSKLLMKTLMNKL